MNIKKTVLEGVYIIEPQVFGDERGWFMESYSKFKLQDIDCSFVQDNHSYSQKKGILRGIHFQNGELAQAKLVRCISGTIIDVAVDLRKGSPTYKKWISVELSAQNKKQLFIPRGFGHGFLTLSDDVEILYKADNYYSGPHDRSIIWSDSELGIEWGIETPILSDKDRNAPTLKDSDCSFIYDKIKEIKE